MYHPAIRKGLRPSYATYGDAYGRYWVPTSGHLAKCAEMRDWYAKFIDAKSNFKTECKWPRRGSCGSKYRKQMNDYEKKGKAAWKKCKMSNKLVEATPEAEFSLPENTVFLDYAPDTTNYAPDTTNYAPDTTNYAPPPTQGGYTGEQEGPNWLLIGGAGAGALLLVMLLKK